MDLTAPARVPDVVRVFVSSTWGDLREERLAVQAALQRLSETQFVGMEYFGSDEKTPRDVSLARLTKCRLYIGIIGGRYGSGITEEEYRRAGELGIERYIYIKDAPAEQDAEPDRHARREQFLRTITNTRSLFTTPTDLRAQVTADLHDWLVENIYKPQIRDAGFAANFANDYLSPEPVYERLDLDRFIGRVWLRDEVDRFLSDSGRGYFVLEADAGMGKTAFLAHLVRERRWIHHFAELARDDVSRGLRSLAAQIVFRWQPRLEGAPSDVTRPDYLERLLFAAAARRDEIAPHEKIVLAVDGLDESAALPGQNVMGLPRVLPQGVYVVVSMRPVHVVLQCDTRRAPVRIESAAAANLDDVRAFLTAAAGREPVASILAESRVEAEAFVSTLLERSQGVWIYLHYILEELQRGERRPLDLEALPCGLWAYYAEYWRARRDGPQWDSLELPLLAALAAAREDVSAPLLCAFAGIAETPRTARLLEEWRPFLAGSTSNAERRYRCYHASFREFLEGRTDRSVTEADTFLAGELANATRSAHACIADRYLDAWGGFEAALDGLRDPASRDLDDGYGIRQLVAHLIHVGRLDDVSSLLLLRRERENVWYTVHETVHDLSGYMGDLTVAWRAANAASQAAIDRGEPAPTVTLEARCALLRSSVRGLAERVGSRMLAALVEKGIWEPRHALTYALAITESGNRMLAMSRLLPLLEDPLRQTAFDEAVAAARWSDAASFAELPSGLPHSILQELMSQVTTRGWGLSEVLTALAPHLPPDLLADAVSCVRTNWESGYWDEFLLAAIPHLAPEEREELLGRWRDSAARSTASEKLRRSLRMSRFLSPEERNEIRDEALKYATTGRMSDHDRALVLTRALPLLEGRTRESVARRALEATAAAKSYHVGDILAELIPNLPDKLVRAAEKKFLPKGYPRADRFVPFLPHWVGRDEQIERIFQRVENKWSYDKQPALVALIPLLPDRLVERALRLSLEEASLPQALDALAPRLTEEELRRAISSLLGGSVSARIRLQSDNTSDIIARRGDPPPSTRELSKSDAEDQSAFAQARHQVRLAASASGSERARFATQALHATERLFREDGYKAELLIALALLSTGSQRDRLLARGVSMIRSGAFRGLIPEVPRGMLVAIAPLLSEPLLREALAWTSPLKEADAVSAVLRAVVPHLPEAAALEFLLSGVTIRGGDPSPFPRMQSWRLRAFVSWMLKRLPEPARSNVTEEDALGVLADFLPGKRRARFLARISRTYGGWMMHRVLDDVRNAFPPAEKVELLVELLPALQPADFSFVSAEALIAAFSLTDPAARRAAVELIAPYLHPFYQRSLRRAFMAAPDDEESAFELLRDTASVSWLLRQLDALPAERRASLVERALGVIDDIEIPALRTWAMLQLVPELPEHDAVQTIDSSLFKVGASAFLLIERWGSRRSPLPPAIVRAVMDKYDRAGHNFIALIPHLPDALVMDALDRVWIHREALAALALRVSTLQRPELYKWWRRALLALASRTDAAFQFKALLPVFERLGGRYDS
ncbi:MAG TPA: DUF4062 domain-containing protein [Thermoanaerobaculia bacterium]|nr:DUF4062 domain-containing protein [Thermoanaerobaculia bacterium]